MTQEHPVFVYVLLLCVAHVFVVRGVCVNATQAAHLTCVQRAIVCVMLSALPHNMCSQNVYAANTA
jgi:hypothetical protein